MTETMNELTFYGLVKALVVRGYKMHTLQETQLANTYNLHPRKINYIKLQSARKNIFTRHFFLLKPKPNLAGFVQISTFC